MAAHARDEKGWTQLHIGGGALGLYCGIAWWPDDRNVAVVFPPLGKMPSPSTHRVCHECFESYAMAIVRGADGWDRRWHIAAHEPQWRLRCGGDPMAGMIHVAGPPDWRIHERESFCPECLNDYEIETGW